MPCRREDSLRRMGAAHTDQGLVTVVALCCRRRVVKVTDGSHSVWMDGPPLANPTPTVSVGMGDSQSEKNVLESVNTGGMIAAPCFPSTRRGTSLFRGTRPIELPVVKKSDTDEDGGLTIVTDYRVDALVLTPPSSLVFDCLAVNTQSILKIPDALFQESGWS